MSELVEEKYKEWLRNEGKLGELIDVDVIGAIDLLVERGQWEKALETARQRNLVITYQRMIMRVRAATGTIVQ